MTEHEKLIEALRQAGPRPADDAKRDQKKNWSQKLSEQMALAVADILRNRGLDGALPRPASGTHSGAERRMAGGLGAKKVDVTWATEEAGLMLAVSIKTINFRDNRSQNYQKNLTNRRADLMLEAVTLHQRFPYSVLIGFFLLHQGAAEDETPRRNSTFENAHRLFEIASGRADPGGRVEQFEQMYIALHDPNPFQPSIRFYLAGDGQTEIAPETIFNQIVETVARRTPDLYQVVDGRIRRG